MTTSLPMTLPAPASPKAAAAPSRGSNSAAPAGGSKADHSAAAQAGGVADMFAALVAALTSQMQPSTNVFGEVGGDLADGTPGTTAPGAPTTDLLGLVGQGSTDGADLAMPEQVLDAGPADAAVDLVPVAVDNSPEPAANRAVPAQPGEPTQSAQPVQPARPGGDTADDAAPQHQGQRPPTPQAQAVAAAVAPPGLQTVAEAHDRDRSVTAVPAAPATASTPAAERVVATQAPQRPAPVPDAHVQVARVVRPLRLGNDGAYELALDLTPAELGRVRIDVELRGATISLSLRADNPATRELLQSSLSQLRSELEAAGLHAGSLDVGSSGAQDQGAAAQQESEIPVGTADSGDADPLPADEADLTSQTEPTTDGVDVLA